MADTLNVDIFSMTLLPEIVPIVGLPHPVINIALSEGQIRQLIQLPNYNIYKAGTRDRVDGHTINDYFPHGGGGGGGGTTDYNQLENKPSIDGITLRGDTKLADLGVVTLPETGTVGQPLLVKSLKNNKPYDLKCADYDPYDKIDIDAVIE